MNNWTSYNRQRAEINELADIRRTKKHIYYCDLVISACIGASLTIIAVIAHMMIVG
jgi:hypothetical protein